MTGGFEYLYTVRANGVIPVSKYKSAKTGLSLMIAEVAGPLVNGYFCLATEAHDDDGLPHTLEHLVFMGSERCPFKGVLDLLANRCLASGTNAWTDVDHTSYTMTTAGSEGFSNLLPIYLEHILYPTLTESAYITEVHHIDGEGEDAGVVYCEMQATENSAERLTYQTMLREMYRGRCGYKAVTGGIMDNLRTSTSHTKVRHYHREFYRPENLCLIVTGHIRPEDLLPTLHNFETTIVQKGPIPGFTRPWRNIIEPLQKSVIKEVLYPSDDETHGLVYYAVRGPLAKEQALLVSLMTLLEYLTHSPISPLQREFIELDEPYCSKVIHSVIENSETCIYFLFLNVPTEKLEQISEKLKIVLLKIATKEEEIDMNRMKTVIHRKILDSLSAMETDPHDTLAFTLIGDFLFGDTKEDLEVRVSDITCLQKLKAETEDFWVKLLNRFFVDKPYVGVVGKPSNTLMKEMGQAEKDRIAKQREELGKDGLQEKKKILQNAIENNEVEPPLNLLSSMPVPNVSKIHFHNIKSYGNQPGFERSEKFPLDNIPFRMQLDDINTNFVEMVALLDSTNLSDDLRYYLPLFTEILCESPITRNGVLIPHEEVIAQLQADTLENSCSLGISGSRFYCDSFPQIVALSLKLECGKYVCGVQWLQELLHQTRFTVERIKIVASKMINDVPQLKRQGADVVKTIFKDLLFTKDCNHYISSMFKQHKFLTQLIQNLENDAEMVINNLEKLRKVLTVPDNLSVHLTLDISKLPALPHKPWTTFVSSEPAMYQTSMRPPIKKTSEYVLPLELVPIQAVIVGVGSEESAHLIQAVPSISSYIHPDLAALEVLIQYMTQCEGPMWRQIRGLGLAYTYRMFVRPETGLLYFLLFKSTNLRDGYKEALDIAMGYIEGRTSFSEIELESAKSSLIFEIIEQEKTAPCASMQSLLSYYKGISLNYNREMLQEITRVSLDDLSRVGTLYVAPLFDPAKVRSAIVCHPSKVAEVKEGLQQFLLNIEVLTSPDEEFQQIQ